MRSWVVKWAAAPTPAPADSPLPTTPTPSSSRRTGNGKRSRCDRSAFRAQPANTCAACKDNHPIHRSDRNGSQYRNSLFYILTRRKINSVLFAIFAFEFLIESLKCSSYSHVGCIRSVTSELFPLRVNFTRNGNCGDFGTMGKSMEKA